MDRIARASTDERRLVFEAAARRMALAPAVVEKDFWVCYTLDHLFHRSGFAESMVFKGGTSLSKAFGLIERFSEDIVSVNLFFTSSANQTRRSRKGGFTACANVFSPIPVTP